MPSIQNFTGSSRRSEQEEDINMKSNQLKERIDWLYSLFCEACSNRSIICWKVLGSNRLFRAAFISSSFCSSSFFRRSASLHRFSCFCLWFWASFSSYLASSLLSWHSCRPSFAICNSFFIFWVWFSCVNSKSSFSFNSYLCLNF